MFISDRGRVIADHWAADFIRSTINTNRGAFDHLGSVTRDQFLQKAKLVAIEQRGKLVEFPKAQFAAQSKTEDITERGEVSPSTVLFFGCF